MSSIVGFGKGGSSVSRAVDRLEDGLRLATRAGKGGGPIIPVDGRLEGRAVSLPDECGIDERAKGNSRLGGKGASAVFGRLKSSLGAVVEVFFHGRYWLIKR
jgi:hypothetical protein